MTECSNCGASRLGYFHVDGKTLCRMCYESDKPEKRHREANNAYEEQQNRERIINNGVNT